MKHKKLMTIISIVALSGLTLAPSSTSIARIMQPTNKTLLIQNQVQNNSKGCLQLFNNKNDLVGNINFNPNTKKVSVSLTKNSFTGTSSSNAILLNLYKPGSMIPYKTVTVLGNESLNNLKEIFNNVDFQYGDLVSIYTNNQIAKVTAENGAGTPNTPTQSFILSQNGLEKYSQNVSINPVNIKSGEKSVNVTGKSAADAIIYINVDGTKYSGQANANGDFSIPIKTENLTSSSKIEVSSYYGLPTEAKLTIQKELTPTVSQNINTIIANPINLINVQGRFNERYEMTTTGITISGRTNSNIPVSIYVTELPSNETSGVALNKILYTQSNSEGYFSSSINYSGGFTAGNTFVCICATAQDGVEMQQYAQINSINSTGISVNKPIVSSTSKYLDITGTAPKNTSISINIGNSTFTGKTNSNGEFNIPTIKNTDFKNGENAILHFTTDINNEQVTLRKLVPITSEITNITKTTDSGFNYTLNPSHNVLLNSELSYFKSNLTPVEFEQLKFIYKSILNYNNINNNHQEYLGYNNNRMINLNFVKAGLPIPSMDELQNLLTEMTNVIPQMAPLLWDQEQGYYNISNHMATQIGYTIEIGNGMQNSDVYQQTLKKVRENAANILSSITPNMNEYQIIGAVENAFSKSYIYGATITSHNNQDIIGSLINHKAVCAGISQGIAYLLNSVGIETIPVIGNAVNGQVSPHEWDYVDIYGKWYLIDNTWQAQGNFNNWYLAGQNLLNYTKTHIRDTNYSGNTLPIPKLQNNSINYNTIKAGQSIVNLMGTTNYKVNSNGTVTITYDDTNNIDKNVQVNLSSNGWKPLKMTNNGSGLWSATVNTKDINNLYFYFTVNNLYGTAGNIATHNLTTSFRGNGITAVKA